MLSINALLKKSDIRFCDVANAHLPHLATIPVEVFGEECEVKVKERDVVSEGTVLTVTQSSRCLRSSVPGIIEKIEERLLANGRTVKCAEIKTEGAFSFLAKKAVPSDWRNLSMRETRVRIAKCGVENLFDFSKPSSSLGEEISEFPRSTAQNLIVRLFDSDPSCGVDLFIAKNFFEKVSVGAQIVAGASAAQRIVFACAKSDAPFFAEKIKGIKNGGIVKLDEKMLFGGKKELLSALSDAEKEIHFSENDLAVDSETLLDVYNAVLFEKPVTEHFVLISGNAVARPLMLKARIGTSAESLLRECGGLKFPPNFMAANGILKGVALRDIKVPVSQDIKSISFFRRKTWANSRETPCIRCGACHYACPADLFPEGILSCQDESSPIFRSASLCRECGLCNLACPSRIPILQKILEIKKRGKR